MRSRTNHQFDNHCSHGPPTSGCLLPDHNVFPPWQRIQSIWLFPCCPYKWFVGHPPFCHWCLVYVPLYLQYPYYWQQNHMIRTWSPCNSQTAPSAPLPHCDNCLLCLCSQIWFSRLIRTIWTNRNISVVESVLPGATHIELSFLSMRNFQSTLHGSGEVEHSGR